MPQMRRLKNVRPQSGFMLKYFKCLLLHRFCSQARWRIDLASQMQRGNCAEDYDVFGEEARQIVTGITAAREFDHIPR